MLHLDTLFFAYLHLLFVYSYIDLDSGTARVEKYKSVEPAYVDQVLKIGIGMENRN